MAFKALRSLGKYQNSLSGSKHFRFGFSFIKNNLDSKIFFSSQKLEKHENGHQKYVEIYRFKPDPRTGLAGKYAEPQEGVHYEIYWMLEGETLPTRKLNAFLHKRNNVSKIIEETGRESYLLYRQGDHGGYVSAIRDQLFPVKAA